MKPACETKGKLLQIALRLIWENSYGSVGVEEMCKQAGVKKGSFYYFFPSKSDLTSAALEAHWEAQRVDLDQIFSPATPPLATSKLTATTSTSGRKRNPPSSAKYAAARR